MKPYGMTRVQRFDRDDDVAGVTSVAGNTRAQGRLKANSYRSLRRGKKTRIRQRIKKQARAAARIESRNGGDDVQSE